MKHSLILLIISYLLASANVSAEEAQAYKVNTFVVISYPDGKTTAVSKDGGLEIGGFDCTFSYGEKDAKHSGVSVICKGAGSNIGIAARCDSTKPGFSNSISALVSNDPSTDGAAPMVMLGCDTTHKKLSNKISLKNYIQIEIGSGELFTTLSLDTKGAIDLISAIQALITSQIPIQGK